MYSKPFGMLLGNELKVTERALKEALAAEQKEINYDTESHLCTLCLQIVRVWSEDKTLAGGLSELAIALDETTVKLERFITSNWNVKELA
jgi:hypothetical protein